MAKGYYDLSTLTDFIVSEAKKRGIDPDIALRVARSEGLQPDTWQSNVRDSRGQRERSFGPFQLYDSGLGAEFKRLYGKSAEDPSTVYDQVRFSLDQAAKGGWGPWHGWKGDPRAGLPGGPAASQTMTMQDVRPVPKTTQIPGYNAPSAAGGPQAAADAANPHNWKAAQAAQPQPDPVTTTTTTPAAPGTPVQTIPGVSGTPYGATQLAGKAKEKSLGGLLGELADSGGQTQLSTPNMLPQGGGATNPPLSEYIQQYIAQRLRGQPPGPQGGGSALG